MNPIAATDWDAGRYHRISAPQFEWGQRVLERLRPRNRERILCVCVRHHLDCLPPGLRDPFVRGLTARAARRSPGFVLDYRRLNLSAARAVR